MKRHPSKKGSQRTNEWLERATTEFAKEMYVLRLYVAGTTPQSQRALTNLKRLCEQHLKGRYSLEVIDVYQALLLTKEDQVFAVPTLVKLSPLPKRQLLGDLSDEARVLAGLGLA